VNSDVVPRLRDSCAKQGFEPVEIASGTTTQKSWTQDSNFEGAVFAGTNALYTDSSVPGVKEFLDALEEYAPEVPASPQFSAPLIFPWAGGQLFTAAAEAADITPTSTGADVVRGLRSLKDETLDGVAPPLNFPEGQPGFPLCYFSGLITEGAFKSDGEPTCIDQAAASGLLAALQG
jgi:branched-chain amino acid transport system substrate-binding protein